LLAYPGRRPLRVAMPAVSAPIRSSLNVCHRHAAPLPRPFSLGHAVLSPGSFLPGHTVLSPGSFLPGHSKSTVFRLYRTCGHFHPGRVKIPWIQISCSVNEYVTRKNTKTKASGQFIHHNFEKEMKIQCSHFYLLFIVSFRHKSAACSTVL